MLSDERCVVLICTFLCGTCPSGVIRGVGGEIALRGNGSAVDLLVVRGTDMTVNVGSGVVLQAEQLRSVSGHMRIMNSTLGVTQIVGYPDGWGVGVMEGGSDVLSFRSPNEVVVSSSAVFRVGRIRGLDDAGGRIVLASPLSLSNGSVVVEDDAIEFFVGPGRSSAFRGSGSGLSTSAVYVDAITNLHAGQGIVVNGSLGSVEVTNLQLGGKVYIELVESASAVRIPSGISLRVPQLLPGE